MWVPAVLFVLVCSALAGQETETPGVLAKELSGSDFWGLTLQTGFGSALSAVNIGDPINYSFGGPGVLVGIVSVERGISTLVEIEVVKSIDFTSIAADVADGQTGITTVLTPDILITPRLLFVYWLGNLGIEWGASWSQVVTNWTYQPEADYVSMIVGLQQAIPMRTGDTRFVFVAILEGGLLWHDLASLEAIVSSAGWQWFLGVRFYFPMGARVR